MKKILIVALVLPILQPLSSMENPAPLSVRHQCSTKCLDVCQEVKNNHNSLIQDMQSRLKSQTLWQGAAGKSCGHIKSEGLEILFAEKEASATPASQRKAAKMFPATQAPLVSQEKQTPSQYTDIDTLLVELEKDLPSIPVKKLTLCDHAAELTTLIKRGSAQALALLKKESTYADVNNLDATARLLENKNNEFLDAYKRADEAQRSNTGCLRLALVVPQAVDAAEKLCQKEPISTYSLDIAHPFNSYKNEIELLQHSLQLKK